MGWRKCVPVLLFALILATPKCGGHVWNEEDEARALHEGRGRFFSASPTPVFGAGVPVPQSGGRTQNDIPALSQGSRPSSQLERHTEGGSAFGGRTQDSETRFQYPAKDRFQDTVNRFEGRTQDSASRFEGRTQDSATRFEDRTQDGSSDRYSRIWTKEDEIRARNAGQGRLRYVTADFGAGASKFDSRRQNLFSQFQGHIKSGSSHFGERTQDNDAQFIGHAQDSTGQFDDYSQSWTKEDEIRAIKAGRGQVRYATSDSGRNAVFLGRTPSGPRPDKFEGRTQDGPAKFEYDYVKFEGRSRDRPVKFEGRSQDGPAKFEGRTQDGPVKFESRTQDGLAQFEGRTQDGLAQFEGRTEDGAAKFEYDYVKFEGGSRDGPVKFEGRTRDSTAKLEGRTQGKESRSKIWTEEDESLAISEGRGKVRYATPEFGVHTSQPQVDDTVQAENRAPDHTTPKQVSKLTGEIEAAEIIEEAEPICLTCRFFEDAKKPVEVIKLKKPEPEKTCLSCHIFDEPPSDESEVETRQPDSAESEGGMLRGTLNLIAGLFQGQESTSTEKETQQNSAPINPKFRPQNYNVDLESPATASTFPASREYPPKGDQAKIEYLRYRKGQEAKQDYVSSPSAGFAARAQSGIKANAGSRSQSGEGFSGHPQDKHVGSLNARDPEYSQERQALLDSTEQDTAARYGSQTQPILIPLRQNQLNQPASADITFSDQSLEKPSADARIISEVQDPSASSDSRSDQTQDPLASANSRFGGKIKIPSFASVNAGFGGKIIKKPSFASVNAGFGGNIIIKKPSFASVNAGFGGKIIKKPSFASVNAGFGGQIRHPSVGFGYRSRNEAAETRFRDREQDQSATNTRVGGQIEGQSETADNQFGAQINDQPSSGFAREYPAAGRGPQNQDIHLENEYRQSLLDTNAQDSPSAALPNVQLVQLRPIQTQQQKGCTTCHLVQDTAPSEGAAGQVKGAKLVDAEESVEAQHHRSPALVDTIKLSKAGVDSAPSEGSTGQVKVAKLVDVEESVEESPEAQHNRSPALVETIKLSKGGVDTIKVPKAGLEKIKLSKTGAETIKVSKLVDRKEESMKEEPQRRLSASSVRSKKKTRGCKSCFLFDD